MRQNSRMENDNRKVRKVMKNEKYRNYICWGITAFVVLALLVGLIFVLVNWRTVQGICGLLADVLAPVIYGAVFAYLLAPIYNRIRSIMTQLGNRCLPSEKLVHTLACFLATAVSIAILVTVVTGLISMLIPSVIESVTGVLENLPANIVNLEQWLEQVLANNPDLEAQVMQGYEAAATHMQNLMSGDQLNHLKNILSGVSNGLMNIVNTVLDLVIGLIAMAYLLNMKEKLVTQIKMIIYGILPLKAANKFIDEARYVHHVFGGFIIGKLLDSLIIGILCFVLLSFMNMPYVLLVSVIVGVTNIVPFFGPFIGAIPSAFLILLASPLKCLYFIIFILLLQQFDGNILGPKILGDSTGVSSFWVLFSILLFGGLFGFVGMVIGVPTFAVIYRLTTELIVFLLGKKQLSSDIREYENLDHIDEQQKTYMKK